MSASGTWTYACAVLVGIGDGLALLEWSPVVAGLTTVLLSGCVAAVVAVVRPAPGGPSPARRAWAVDVAAGSLLAGGGAVTLLALATASPCCALLLALTATLTAPPVVRRVRRRLRPRAPVGPPARPQAPWDTGLRSLTTAAAVSRLADSELCVLWRRTFWQLTSHQAPDALLATVLLRQACLDELTRRNPTAVRAWLESGGRASGGPERFWVTGRSHGDADAAS